MADRPRRWTDDQLRSAVESSRTMSDVCRALGLVPAGGNYDQMWRHIDRLGIDASHLRRPVRRGSRPRLDEAAVVHAVPRARSVEEVCRTIGEPTSRRSSVARLIGRLGLDTSHFVGQGWRKGSTTPVRPARPLHEVLVVGPITSSAHLRQRLLGAGRKRWCCEACGRHEWEGSAIPLELDHVNGDRNDNRLENLRLVCPNCHAQTPTYRGRNIGRRGGTQTRLS